MNPGCGAKLFACLVTKAQRLCRTPVSFPVVSLQPCLSLSWVRAERQRLVHSIIYSPLFCPQNRAPVVLPLHIYLTFAMRKVMLFPVVVGLFCLISYSSCTFSSLVDISVISPISTPINHKYFHPFVAVPAGSSLILRCSLSERLVAWRGKSSNILHLDNVLSADAGLYTCCDKESPSECSSIHIFVRDYFSTAKLISRAHGDPIVLPLVQNQPAIIPCMPNAPETRLELKSTKTWKKIEDSGFKVKYDPTVGYSLQKPTWTEEWVHMKCSTLSWTDTLDVVIYWHVAPLSDPVVSLESPGPQFKAGSQFTLTCRVKTEGETITQVIWKHENTIIKTSNRVHQLTYLRQTKPFNHWIQLTVLNVTPRDSGKYICEISVSGSHRSYASEPVQILVRNDTVVRKPLKVNSLAANEDLIVEAGKNLTLTAEYENLRQCAHWSHVWTHAHERNGLRFVKNVSDEDATLSVHDNGTITRFQLYISDVQSDDAGTYTLSLAACGQNGSASYRVQVPDSGARIRNDGRTDNFHVIIGVVSLIVVVLLFVCLAHVGKSGHHESKASMSSTRLMKICSGAERGFSDQNFIGEYVKTRCKSSYSGKIIPRSKLKIESGLIGKGQYGCVSKGKIHDQDVAIKRLKEGENREHEMNLIDELVILDRLQSQGGHGNLVKLIGACFDPQIMLVFEYCSGGNLTSFLQKVEFTATAFAYRVNKMLNTPNHGYYNFVNNEMTRPVICMRHIIAYASQIASAMKFLSDKKVIHRDVAARNVLVNSLYHVQLCDLGLAKFFDQDEDFEYRTPSSKALPYKWLALESFGSMGSFTTKSDVWAFGIFMWELFELGKLPYESISEPQHLVNFLMDGKRLPKPSVAPDPVYHLMLTTWNENPNDRPTFGQICKDLEYISKQFES